MKAKCFHCGKWFEHGTKKYEKCPHCGKGLKDLSEEAQTAVRNTIETIHKYIKQCNSIVAICKNIEYEQSKKRVERDPYKPNKEI